MCRIVYRPKWEQRVFPGNPDDMRVFLGLGCVLVASLVWTAGADHSAPEKPASVRLNGQTFVLPSGFEVEVAAGPPLVTRPITADFDELGRLYVADSSGSNEPVH